MGKWAWVCALLCLGGCGGATAGGELDLDAGLDGAVADVANPDESGRIDASPLEIGLDLEIATDAPADLEPETAGDAVDAAESVADTDAQSPADAGDDGVDALDLLPDATIVDDAAPDVAHDGTADAADLGPPPCDPASCDDGDPCTDDRCDGAVCRHEAIPPLTVVAVTGFEPGDAPATIVAQPGGHGWTVKSTADATEGAFSLYGGNPQASPLGYGGANSDATAIVKMTVPASSDTAQLVFDLRVTAVPSFPARVEVRINGALRLSVHQTAGFETFRVPVLDLAGASVVASFRFVAKGGPGVLAGGAWLDAVRLEAAAPAACLGAACVIDAGCPPADACLSPRCLPSGKCGWVPVACDDQDPCTLDYCDGGICLTVPNPCDDANPCTIDGCGPGGCVTLGSPVTTSLIESWAGANPLGAWQTQQPIGAPTWAVFQAASLPEPLSSLGGPVLYMPRDVGIGGLSANGTATLPLPIGGGLGRALSFQVALATVEAGLTGDRFEVHLGGKPVFQASAAGVHTVQIALPGTTPPSTPLTLKFRAVGEPEFVGGVAVGPIQWKAVDKACATFRPCVIDGQCEDGDPCTTERCVAQACEITEVVCLPGEPCADAPCDGSALCSLVAVGCDDGDPCTVDACAAPPDATVNEPELCSFETLVAADYVAAALDLEAPQPEIELLSPNGGLGWAITSEGVRLADDVGPVSDYGGAPVLAVLRWTDLELPSEATLRLTFSLQLDDADAFVDHLAVFRGGTRLWALSASLGSAVAPVSVDIPLGPPGSAAISLVFEADAPALAGGGPLVRGFEIVGVVNAGCGAACVLAGGCDDGDPCTLDRCDGGVCSHVAVACDDGLSCTAESCAAGRCAVTTDRCESGTE
ncbi:MAG: hypothetical protein R3F39_12775 [Myxococcota bacterium]